MLLFQPPASPPVSYGREIAPIFAMHCDGCHGGAGGLSTRSTADLIAGGNSGSAITPGDPERSILLHFIDGRRGEQRRMPLGGRALSERQIAIIARWIAEGARADGAAQAPYTYSLRDVRAERGEILRISWRISTPAYAILTVRDPRTGRSLHSDGGSIKAPREAGDIGAPGETIFRDVRAARDWPGVLLVELSVRYAPSEPVDPQLRAVRMRR